MEFVKGYFTIEGNIRGLTTQEIERRLGFRAGRLDQGCRILALVGEPNSSECISRGSTSYSGGGGLRGIPFFRPSAWLRQRLVKVEPVHPHTPWETYPPCVSIAAEQWELTQSFPAHEICRLRAGDIYRG